MKPPAIRRAIALLWFSLGISLGAVPFEWSWLRSVSSVFSIVSENFLSAGLFAFFIWKIGQGKNWARITYLVLFVLGGLILLWAIPKVPFFPRIAWLVLVVQTVLQSYVMLLLFTGPGR